MLQAQIPQEVPLRKRFLDLILTIPGLLIISPLLFLIAIVVRIQMGPPAIFKQTRPGHKGKLFSVYKFRTMTDDRDEAGELLPDAARITRLGRLLRSFSLDELPELFNVLRGEMSLVGPRPLLTLYLDRYTPEQARRHDVLPGITGWAQVNGRNTLTWEDKFHFDVWYVENWSLRLDIKILLRTMWIVITREGISQPGFPTAEEFFGIDDDPQS
ncbi:MAG: sugar transferase [Anaerolineales bacterium]